MPWAIPLFDHLVEFSGASHIGRVRSTNEDLWWADPTIGLFVVADGMGGHAAGDVAARVAVEELGHSVQSPERTRLFEDYTRSPTLEKRRAVFEALEAGAGRAHAAVRETAARDARQRGMGCTLDAALLLGSKAFLVHVGDGRSYLARPTTTIQLTQDHTVHGSLVTRGLITPSEPPAVRNVLTNAVGRKGELHVEEVFVDLSQGDRLLLCTDGVHAELGDEDVISELTRRGPADDTVIALINEALAKGGRDNATALVLEVGPRRADRLHSDAGHSFRDAAITANCALLAGMSEPLVSRALSAAIEVEFQAGDSVPRYFAGDRVGYILLEGRLHAPSGWTFGPASLVYPESLAGGGHGPSLCKAEERTRALRLRADDIREVCRADTRLAAELYQRLAHILARTATT